MVVQVKTADGWHTYAMDNKQRAKEALAGKMSLGVEENTQVTVSQGLQVTGPWYQSEPKDFSQPKLRWFTWGFDGPPCWPPGSSAPERVRRSWRSMRKSATA